MAPSMLAWRSRGLQTISQSLSTFSRTNFFKAINYRPYTSSTNLNTNRESSTLENSDEEDDGKCFANIENPYKKEPKKCIICKNNIELDYKNARLLSQFVSPYTGGIYNRSVTGLCIYMQKRIAKLIRMSRRAGYMGYTMKDPAYLADPKLFDQFKRK